MRISISTNDDHFQGKYWNHLKCFTLKPRFIDLDPKTQIYELEKLTVKDRNSVIELMEEELERLRNKGKKTSKAIKKAVL